MWSLILWPVWIENGGQFLAGGRIACTMSDLFTGNGRKEWTAREMWMKRAMILIWHQIQPYRHSVLWDQEESTCDRVSVCWHCCKKLKQDVMAMPLKLSSQFYSVELTFTLCVVWCGMVCVYVCVCVYKGCCIWYVLCVGIWLLKKQITYFSC